MRLFRMLGKKGFPSLAGTERVLLIRTDEIGDVVMSTPLLRELRRNLPNSWITLLVKDEIKNLVESCPYIDQVLPFNTDSVASSLQLSPKWATLLFAIRHLWVRRFELAIIPRWDVDLYRATLLAYFSGAPFRIGYSERVNRKKQLLNASFDCLLNHPLNDPITLKHEVLRNLDMIRSLGGTVQDDRLELWLTPEDEAFAERIFLENDIMHQDLVIAIGPSGGNSTMKQWPLNNFVEIARWIREQLHGRILILGGPGEEALGWDISRQIGAFALSMIGKTSLRQTAALLKRCRLYVGNDSGLAHMASAVKTPVVVIYGPSCPHRFRPWGENSLVVWSARRCSPCFTEDHADRCQHCIYDRPLCLEEINIQLVKDAILDLLPHEMGRDRVDQQPVTDLPFQGSD